MIAAGSVAGTMSDDFSTAAALNLYSFDLYEDDLTLNLQGSLDAEEKLNKLDWATQDNYSLGLLGGALVDGAVKVWDPSVIIGDSAGESCVCSIEAHENATTTLQFNPVHTQLLATTGQDSEIRIWSLQDPTQPTLSMSPTSSKSPISGDIKDIQWHLKLSHILACCTTGGKAHIWDLKAKRCTSTFSNSKGKGPITSLAWDPENPTRIAVAVDGTSPLIEVWDLRKAIAPLHSLSGHTDTILSLSWCATDSNLLLSSGADGKTTRWNPNSGTFVCEFEAQSNWVFDVQWSRFNPTTFATSSYDNALSVFSLNGCSDSSSTTNAKALGQPDLNSLKKPCAIACGYDGKLYVVRNESSASGEKAFVAEFEPIKNLNISNLDEAAALLHEISLLMDFEQIEARASSARQLFDRAQSIFQTQENEAYSVLLEIAVALLQGNLGEKVEELLPSTGSFSGNSEVESAPVEADEKCETELTQLVLTGKIDSSIRWCVQKNRFDDAFMMLPFASPESQASLYAEYVHNRKRSFYVRALNAVRTGEVIQCIEKEDIGKTTWQSLLLFGLNYCDESDLFTIYEILTGKLEALWLSEEDHREKHTIFTGLMLMYMLSRNFDALFRMITVDTALRSPAISYGPPEVWKSIQDDSWTNSHIFKENESVLLEILCKSMGIIRLLGISDIPKFFFALTATLCHSLCAQGGITVAHSILDAVVGISCHSESISGAQEECIDMHDRLSHFLNTQTDTSHRDDNLPSSQDAVDKIRVPCTSEQVPPTCSLKAEVCDKFESMNLQSEQNFQNRNAHLPMEASYPTTQPTPVRPITQDFETSFRNETAEKLSDERYSPSFVTSQSSHHPVGPHMSNIPTSPLYEKPSGQMPPETTHRQEHEPHSFAQRDRELPSSYGMMRESPNPPRPEASLPPSMMSRFDIPDSDPERRPIQNNTISTTTVPQVSTTAIPSCVNLKNVNVQNSAGGNVEHQVITNFRNLLEEVTDRRKKECIQKSLETLAQLFTEGKLDPVVVDLLHRFTLTSKTQEGKDIIKLLGAEHWNSFRLFLNIKFL
ncbi:secretory protein Sec31 [Perkinsela sp. CCAP 1560/4]|nr:secretory protein Sec31 [Perkinsela sp. CCAP 1560/4]|eukprot:KNH09449.1 secretory protein Sec31 [Perkinsela sp. CCAP 1560/4]